MSRARWVSSLGILSGLCFLSLTVAAQSVSSSKKTAPATIEANAFLKRVAPSIYIIEAVKALIKRFPNQRYDFYFKDRREVFYAIPKAQGIWSLHAQLALNREPETVAKYGEVHSVKEMIVAFEFAMNESEVDKKRIDRAEKRCYDKADEQGDRLLAHIRKNSETPTTKVQEGGL